MVLWWLSNKYLNAKRKLTFSEIWGLWGELFEMVPRSSLSLLFRQSFIRWCGRWSRHPGNREYWGEACVGCVCLSSALSECSCWVLCFYQPTHCRLAVSCAGNAQLYLCVWVSYMSKTHHAAALSQCISAKNEEFKGVPWTTESINEALLP